MDIGVVLPYAGQTDTADSLTRFAAEAELLGYHSVWAGDHLAMPESPTDYPYTVDGAFPRSTSVGFVESFSVLAFVSAVTNKIKLGSSVTVVPYRHPILQAKLWASIDHLSRGRAIFGVGAGWSSGEFAAMGVPFAERGAITDEYLDAARALWENEQPFFAGRYCKFESITLMPKPVQRPFPIWIGGHSRPAIRRAARYGQAWHVARTTPEALNELFPVFEAELKRSSRRREDVVVSLKRRIRITDVDIEQEYQSPTGGALIGTTAEMIEDIKKCAGLGIQHLTFDFQTMDVDRQIGLIRHIAREILPRVS